jgi:hypothetical protein
LSELSNIRQSRRFQTWHGITFLLPKDSRNKGDTL